MENWKHGWGGGKGDLNFPSPLPFTPSSCPILRILSGSCLCVFLLQNINTMLQMFPYFSRLSSSSLFLPPIDLPHYSNFIVQAWMSVDLFASLSAGSTKAFLPCGWGRSPTPWWSLLVLRELLNSCTKMLYPNQGESIIVLKQCANSDHIKNSKLTCIGSFHLMSSKF